MTEQEKQKLKDALIEHKNIATSEYDDEDAFVGIYFCDLVDIIDSVMDNTGWHPVSELPPLDEDGNSQDVIVICGTVNSYFDVPLPRWSKVVNGIWGDKDVKLWCYPPKED